MFLALQPKRRNLSPDQNTCCLDMALCTGLHFPKRKEILMNKKKKGKLKDLEEGVISKLKTPEVCHGCCGRGWVDSVTRGAMRCPVCGGQGIYKNEDTNSSDSNYLWKLTTYAGRFPFEGK